MLSFSFERFQVGCDVVHLIVLESVHERLMGSEWVSHLNFDAWNAGDGVRLSVGGDKSDTKIAELRYAS